ncbi:GH13653 [Drosophila grimshawi]|uniref:GH13653 n=1 Tax=Drosophila grimshawi TaxID=7222 RepID=B4JTT2_DROGR|nr:GH13653 [Drosophila grimshawi]
MTLPAAGQPDDVHIWANKFLRDLDNLMGGDKLPPHIAAIVDSDSASTSSSPTSRTAPMLLSAAASAALQSRFGKGPSSVVSEEQQQNGQNGLVLKPEKHVS